VKILCQPVSTTTDVLFCNGFVFFFVVGEEFIKLENRSGELQQEETESKGDNQ
jgi:hypothetical protein